MAFGRSVINKGPETHSDPLIDLTTEVRINTHTHTHLNELSWMVFVKCAGLQKQPLKVGGHKNTLAHLPYALQSWRNQHWTAKL